MSENMEKWRHLDGSPAVIDKPFIQIKFQHGNPQVEGVNGVIIEDVIEELIQKLLDFQGRDLACEENAVALWHLNAAQEALVARANARSRQGVRGSKQAHRSAAVKISPVPVGSMPGFETSVI